MVINQVNVSGHTTKEVDLHFTPDGTPVANISLGVNEVFNGGDEKKRKEITTFVDCQIWGGAAESMAKAVEKGTQLLVTGSLRQGHWKDKETGKDRTKMFVKVDSWQFVQNKRAPEQEKGLGR